jgi:hypothetical protein
MKEYQNNQWSGWQSTPIPRRQYGAAVYDEAHDVIIFFGGYLSWQDTGDPDHNDLYFNDTWLWDGANWTEASPTRRPPAQAGSAMTYDTDRKKVILYGGSLGQDPVTSSIWEWDGVDWTEHAPSLAPPARMAASLAYDAKHHVTAMFAGEGSNYTLSDTKLWEWDGATWTARNSAIHPEARILTAMTWDAAREVVVLFGGASDATDSYNMNDTWEWDSSEWKKRAVTTAPSARYVHHMIYDSDRYTTMLYGGFGDGHSNTNFWEWNGALH